MPRKNLIDFTNEELEIINECAEEGNYDHPLYKEYIETENQSYMESMELLKNLGAHKDESVFSEEEEEEMLKEMLEYDDF